MDAVVDLLPAGAQPYAKGIFATILAVLLVVAASTSVPLWVTIVIAVLTPAVVHAVPNKGYQAKPIKP